MPILTSGICEEFAPAYHYEPLAIISPDRKSIEIKWGVVRERARRLQSSTADMFAYDENDAIALMLWLATNEGVKP